MQSPLSLALSALSAEQSDALDRLADWLRIPSVSTDAAYAPEVRRAAEWCAAHLLGSGIEATLEPTGTGARPGHPIVYAKVNPTAPGPHVLFYGHYDVQPADPVELWRSGPFEPVIEPASTSPDGPGARIVARGACDDKGQVATFLEAMRAWHGATGKPAGGLRMTILIEGEEESGSANLEAFVRARADELRACDVCVISDTSMLARRRPAITYGLRGLCYTEVVLKGPDQDLHSGAWGGKLPNPINELCRILGSLHDADRRVTIPGFYDRVQPLRDDEREAWRALGIDAGASLASIGLPPEADVGEAGYSAIEREWARPTCDINGIIGGYTGEGAKTVITTHAKAKVSFRLVPDQDPAQVRDSFFAWLRERTPPGFSWEFIDHGLGMPATAPLDSPLLQCAKRAVQAAAADVFSMDPGEAEPAMIKTGGSIPVAGLLKSELGIDTIFMGFGLEDDRVHSPNEKFEIDCFRLGCNAHARLVAELLDMAGR